MELKLCLELSLNPCQLSMMLLKTLLLLMVRVNRQLRGAVIDDVSIKHRQDAFGPPTRTYISLQRFLNTSGLRFTYLNSSHFGSNGLSKKYSKP